MEKELNEVFEALGKVLHDQKEKIAIQEWEIKCLKTKVEELEKEHGKL